jgi:hypothetical protein
MRRKKMKVLVDLRFLYFLDSLIPHLRDYIDNPKCRVVLMTDLEKDLVSRYLKNFNCRIDQFELRKRNKNVFLKYDKFFSAEINTTYMPRSLFKGKKIQVFHGLGHYNLDTGYHYFSRFDELRAPNKQFYDTLVGLGIEPQIIKKSGYGKLLESKSSSQGNSVKSERIQIIVHWRKGSFFFNNFKTIINAIRASDKAFDIFFHGYTFEKHGEKGWFRLIQRILKEIGNVSVYNKETSLQKIINLNEIFVIDDYSSTCLECIALNKKVFTYKSDIVLSTEFNKLIEKHSILIKSLNINFEEKVDRIGGDDLEKLCYHLR